MTLTRHAEAITIRRNAAVQLDHAIARMGYWNHEFYVDAADSEAIWIIQNAKWSIEAMDSPASNRFWDDERRKYNEILTTIGAIYHTRHASA
jgi:hypothetical protein